MTDTVTTPWFEASALPTAWTRLERAGLKQTAAPTSEQITLADAVQHLRLDLDGGSPWPEESWLQTAIAASREAVEAYTGLLLAPQEVELGLAGFPVDWHWGDVRQPGVSLLTGPLLGVLGITYRDADDVEQELIDADFDVDDFARPPVLYPAFGVSWPAVSGARNCIRIRCRMGYTTRDGSPDDHPLPAALRHAMLLMLGHLYENRENTTELKLIELPLGARSLCEGSIIRLGVA